MTESISSVRGPHRRHRLAGAWAALLLLPLASPGLAARTAAGSSNFSKVTIQAEREQQVRHQVDQFVASVIARPPSHESLLRWNKPVCPLVVGLPRNMGEFVLGRISQAARDAHAPLAGRYCQPNLFVVVSGQPDRVLNKWIARHPGVDTRHGLAPLENFLRSPRPVRVWYNPDPGCAGGLSRYGPSAAGLMSVSTPYPGDVGKHTAAGPAARLGPVYCDNSIDTHLTYGDVRSIAYAIVVADMNKLGHVTLGQLADYVSIVGLADIRADAGGGGAPTILQLFRGASPPQGMTSWDRALLHSLYNTSQSGILQLTDMEVQMTRRIAR